MIKLQEQIHKTGRLGVPTVDAEVYERQLAALSLARLLVEAEADIAAGWVRPARAFLKEFKNARNIRRKGSMVKT
jgi:hypothetical protein